LLHLINDILIKRKYPLPFYCGHFFHGTPVRQSMVCHGVSRYTRSLLRSRIDFKDQNRA